MRIAKSLEKMNHNLCLKNGKSVCNILKKQRILIGIAFDEIKTIEEKQKNLG